MLTRETLGGYHFDDKLAKWPSGSVWESEGQRLYDLVRKNRPKVIVEVGTNYGCSTSWLAMAVRDNEFGRVYSLDNCQQLGDQTGSLIPKDLRPFITLTCCDALKSTSLETVDARGKKWSWPVIDMLFEDCAHTTGFTKYVVENFPARLVAVHDIKHPTAGIVRAEAISVLGDFDEEFMGPFPADCGLGLKVCDKSLSL
jgi:hypothetical protein